MYQYIFFHLYFEFKYLQLVISNSYENKRFSLRYWVIKYTWISFHVTKFSKIQFTPVISVSLQNQSLTYGYSYFRLPYKLEISNGFSISQKIESSNATFRTVLYTSFSKKLITVLDRTYSIVLFIFMLILLLI